MAYTYTAYNYHYYDGFCWHMLIMTFTVLRSLLFYPAPSPILPTDLLTEINSISCKEKSFLILNYLCWHTRLWFFYCFVLKKHWDPLKSIWKVSDLQLGNTNYYQRRFNFFSSIFIYKNRLVLMIKAQVFKKYYPVTHSKYLSLKHLLHTQRLYQEPGIGTQQWTK